MQSSRLGLEGLWPGRGLLVLGVGLEAQSGRCTAPCMTDNPPL